jgi:pyruvate/2-oxoglutarate dehydrogenase complex dihydrolipoamide dehydrogenase (E3) component
MNAKFDTVLFAIGRHATTEYLNVKKIGLHTNSNNGKLITSKGTLDKTNIDNIYALGDVVDGIPELTGTVQKAAVLLAKRLAVDMGKLKIG